MAASGRMAGRRPSPPARILCPPQVAETVRAEIAALDVRAPVEEVVPGDDAEDLFDSLVAHMSGRRPAADPPSPDGWTLLYAQTHRYLEQRPRERFDDRVWFSMTLDAARSRQDAVGVVLGAAREQFGLVLYAGREVPAMPDGAAPPTSLPAGTIALPLDDEGVPADLAAKARRYGWPATADRLPVLLAWDGEGWPGAGERVSARFRIGPRPGAGLAGHVLTASGRINWWPSTSGTSRSPAGREPDYLFEGERPTLGEDLLGAQLGRDHRAVRS
jgi:hypothetical protein